MENLTNKQKGVLFMCAHALLFSGMQIAIRLTGAAIPLMEQVFFRNLVGMIINFCIIKMTKGVLFGERKQQPLLFARSISGTLGLVTLFYASSRAYQADVAIMSKLSPFLVTLWAFLFLKEKIAKVQVPALIIAFAGAVLVTGPAFNSNLFPLLIAFLSSVFASVAYTLLAYSKDKVDPITVVMHFSAFCTALSLPFLHFNFVMPGMQDAILLISMGFLGSFGQITITYAYRMAPASEVSIYNYSGILFSGFLAYFILDETISLTSFTGGFLVVCASYLVYRFTKN